MKTAPIFSEMARYPEHFRQVLVHTGQHYDDNMSAIFFKDLGLQFPDESLSVGSGTHAEQTARVLLAFEPVVLKYRPDWVMVVGDVNSTFACALVCAKLGVPVAHVEAGLRSGDRTMPEEVNRILTDQISDLLFTPSQDAARNLLREGIASDKIHFVGNVMIDTLVQLLPSASNESLLRRLELKPRQYILATLHRPSNVDVVATLREILTALTNVSEKWPVVFPVHPRTRERIGHLGIPLGPKVRVLEPLGYLDFLTLMRSAGMVLTDSGGIQEETAYLRIPCLTARSHTERPITIEQGTNRLVASTCQAITRAIHEAMLGGPSTGSVPPLWDGHAAKRIVQVMSDRIQALGS